MNATTAQTNQIVHPRAAIGAVTGLLVTGVALAVGHLVAAVTTPDASPVIAVGQAAIDETPEWLKAFAIRTFGANDKRALLIGIVLTLAVISIAVGVVSIKRHWIGVAGIVGLTLLGLAAALSRPTASASYADPALAAGLAAGGAYAVLLWSLRPRVERPAPGDAEPPMPVDFDRRRFLATTGALGALAIAAGGAARMLGRNTEIAAERASLTIPMPASPAAPLPAGANLGVPGISPFFTPLDRFYRVDTALLVPRVSPQDWRLAIGGMVDRPFTLTYRDLIALDLIERDITLNCVSNRVGGRYIGTTRWIGAPLKPLLEEAGIQASATQIASRSVDGFTVGTPLPTALDGRDAMLAVAMNGEPLPLEHGFPVRMLVPGLYGYESATKWITSIDLVDDSFQAYWVKRGWAKAVDVKTAARIDTPANGARVNAGQVNVAGVAWAQHRGIDTVQVQVDGGDWVDAELGAVDSPDTWRQWRYRWEASPGGSHLLRVRAVDGTGVVQTGDEAPPFPSGATGYDNVSVEAT